MDGVSRQLPNDSKDVENISPERREELLKEALERIVTDYPPQPEYLEPIKLKGLWVGPTGIAYLFLQVAAQRPELIIASHDAAYWAKSYIDGTRCKDSLGVVPETNCGISCEGLAYLAVRASLTKLSSDVEAFTQLVSEVVDQQYPSEWLKGRAGALYFIRMVRFWVPEIAASYAPLELAAQGIVRDVMRDGPSWTFHGKRYLGAAHGDVGILTEAVLAQPSETAWFESVLSDQLSRQQEDGNWCIREDLPHRHLVQFCHGSPGFVTSILSLRPYFPSLQNSIDEAVARGQDCAWEQIITSKEPNLCHGLFGNALIMPPGQRRTHFLALAMPDNVRQERARDASMFEPADYGAPFSLLLGYWPGAAWAWLTCEAKVPSIIGYNDV